MKVLVVGGYGNFGARIARALAFDDPIDVFVGGRSLDKAKDFAQSVGGSVRGVRVDVDHPDFPDVLRRLAPDLVIHAAGPFQGKDYRVPLAVAAAGAHCIDLADGRRYVCDFMAANHLAFTRAGRSGITGASTVPALSSAVVDHLVAGWQRVDRIDTCIAPAQSAPRGEATIAAVLAYCGEPIRVLENGQWVHRLGWADPTPVSFARMPPRRGALCDVPDLEIFPNRYPGVGTVFFRAALEIGLTQGTFSMLASLRHRNFLPSLEKLAPLMTLAGKVFDPLGSGLGGMVVRVAGVNAQGQSVRRAWHIAADNDSGPEIPCMAAIVLARRLAGGDSLPVGAHACTGLIPLSQFEVEFSRWPMVTDLVEE